MSYDDNQKDLTPPIPGEKVKNIGINFLPKFFRTEANKKFLQGTIDQLVQPGVAEKVSGYIGRETAKAFQPTDNYIGDVTNDRKNYQLEPAAVIKDKFDNVLFYKDYNQNLCLLNNIHFRNLNF